MMCREMVPTRDVIAWIKSRLGNTLASKRRNAYQAVAASVSDASESKGETKSEGRPLPAVV